MAEVNKEVYLKQIKDLKQKIGADKDRGVLNGKTRGRQNHLAHLEGLVSGQFQNRKSRLKLLRQDRLRRQGHFSDRYGFL